MPAFARYAPASEGEGRAAAGVRYSSPPVSVQLPVLDRTPSEATSSGNWFVSREELARYGGAAGPTNFFDRMVWSVAEAMFSSESGPPPADRIAWLCADLRDFLLKSGPRPRWIFTLAMFFTVWIAPLFIGKLPPFARLPVADRAEALERFERGTIVQSAAILAIKVTMCILYFEHPDAAHEIGFDGTCKGEHT